MTDRGTKKRWEHIVHVFLNDTRIRYGTWWGNKPIFSASLFLHFFGTFVCTSVDTVFHCGQQTTPTVLSHLIAPTNIYENLSLSYLMQQWVLTWFRFHCHVLHDVLLTDDIYLFVTFQFYLNNKLLWQTSGSIQTPDLLAVICIAAKTHDSDIAFTSQCPHTFLSFLSESW